ncbi:MAG: glycosyltransferase [Lentisphaeria bacterium]
MQICMMTNTYLPHVGGVARSVQTFTREYQKRGHGTLVVAPAFADARKSTADVVRLPAIQDFNGSDFSVRLPIPGFLYDAIEEFQPDLVHSHHPFLLGDTAVRIARQWQRPLIFTHHTLYERYTHYVPFDSQAMRDLAVKLATTYANLCSLVIAPSESIAKLLQKRGVKVPVEVVPTGVDVDFFRQGDRNRGRQTCNIKEDTFVIGHVGRLAEEKNLEYLSQAVAKVLAQNRKVLFLVVGDGEAKSKMTAVFKQHGVEQQLFMPGKLTGSALADAYRAMDLFAFASTSETQGMVVAEAMAASLPVIALDAPGVKEVVQDYENGRLLNSNIGTEEFAEALLEISRPASTEQRRNMAEKAHLTARDFDTQVCVDKMLQSYEQVLTGSDKHPPRHEPQEGWKRIVNGIAAEWELLTQKANTLSPNAKEK